MKNIPFPIIIHLLAICFFFMQCKKNPEGLRVTEGLSVTLYDKSVPQIKSYIGGKWKVNFATGGIANQGQKFSNTDIEFRFQTIDSIFYIQKSLVLANSPITWTKIRDFIGRVDSNYISEFMLRGGGYYGFGFERIKNDTLLIYDPGPDGYTYYLTHQ